MIRVTARVHPFAPAQRDVREFPAGSTINDIVTALVPVEVGRVIVMVDGEECTDRTTVPADGSLVTVSVVPAGSADEMSSAAGKTAGWGAVLGISLFVASFLTPIGWLAWAGVGIMAIGGIVAMGLGAGANIMRGMASAQSSESTLSIAGGRNTISPWGKVPVVIGKHRLSPHYAAGAYTYVSGTDGEDQYLKQIFCLGRNTLKVSDIKLGENLLASNSADVRNGAISVDGAYSNVFVELYQNGTAPSEYDKLVTQDEIGAALTYNNAVWRASAKNTTQLVAAINVAGLYKVENGDRVNHTVIVEARYRVAGSGTAWASCPVLGTLNITRARAKLLRYELMAVVAEGQYEVGLMRTSADDPEDFDGASETTWAALRSHRNIPVVSESMRSKVVLLAVAIKATDQLNGAIDNLNCIAESIEHIYSGSNWTSTAVSRNPASHLIEGLVHGRFLNDPIPSASIDWAAFNAWYTLCASNGWSCDKVLADSATLQELCNRIAHTGRAYITLRDGLYSVVVDEAKTTPVQHFTPRNVRSFTWTKAFGDLPHGYRLGFLSADDDYQTSERLCLYDEYTEATATKLERLDLWGITDATQVWKHGRYLLACRRLRPEAYTFETDVEGIVCEPGDLVLVSHDSIAVGIVSGRIKALTADGGGAVVAVEIDEEIEVEAGVTYGVQIRAVGGYYYRTVTVDGRELTLSSSIPAGVLATGDLYTIGEAGTETMRCVVSSIEAGQDFGCRITCLDEAPGVHTADSGTIPAYTPLIGRKGQDTAIDTDIDSQLVDLRGQISDRPTSSTLSTAPATPASLSARAVQDGITLLAAPGGSPGLDNSAAYYRYQVSRDGGLTWPGDWTAAAQAEYRFDRDVDGYPDSVSLYQARVKAVSAAGVESVSWLTVAVDGTGYVGWTPGTPGLSGSADNRTAELRMVQGGAYYGHNRYEIQIQRDGDGSSWYAPGDSAAARDSETAYRGALNEYASAYADTFAQTLPLINQAAGLPENTSYLYRIRAVVAKPTTADPDAVARSAWTSAITVVAKPTGTVDIVEKAVKTAQLDESAVTLEKLNVLAKNLVNDLTDDADGTTGWTVSSGGSWDRVADTSITPNYKIARLPSGAAVGIYSYPFVVGPNDIIEVEMMARSPSSALCRLRAGIMSDYYASSAWDATAKSWGTFSGNASNIVLHGTASTVGTAYKKILSYIVGANVQPDEIPAPRNDLTATTVCVKALGGSGSISAVRDSGDDLYFFAPSARKEGAGKITAPQIVTKNLAAISAKLGEIEGDTADYKLVMGSGGSAEEGTLLLGALTDESYFRREKVGGVWQIVMKLWSFVADAVSAIIKGNFKVKNTAGTATVFEVDPSTKTAKINGVAEVDGETGQGILSIKSTSALGLQSSLRFASSTDTQDVQIRHNTYDSYRAPYGLIIEKAPSNPQTTLKAFLEVEGKLVVGDGASITGLTTLADVAANSLDVTGNVSAASMGGIAASSSVPGVDITNASTGRGVYVANTSNGQGVYVDNTGTGRGVLVNNNSPGYGVLVVNNSTGYGVYVVNSGTGYGVYAESTTTSSTRNPIAKFVGNGVVLPYFDGGVTQYASHTAAIDALCPGVRENGQTLIIRWIHFNPPDVISPVQMQNIVIYVNGGWRVINI